MCQCWPIALCVFVLLHTNFCILLLSTKQWLIWLFFSLPVFFSGFSIALDKNKPLSLVSNALCLQSHIGHCYGKTLQVTQSLVHSSVVGCPLSLHSISKVFFSAYTPETSFWFHSDSHGAASSLGCGRLRKLWHQRARKQMGIVEEENSKHIPYHYLDVSFGCNQK